MAPIVNEKAAPKLTELVLEAVVDGISGSIVPTRDWLAPLLSRFLFGL